MNLFKRFSGLIGALMAQANLFNPVSGGAVLPNMMSSREVNLVYSEPVNSEYSNRMDIYEFRKLGLNEQRDIQEFILFRYKERISDPRFRNATVDYIINDLTKELQIPVGRYHKHLTREVIERFLT